MQSPAEKRAYYLANRARILAQMRARYVDDPERKRSYNRERYRVNRDHVLERTAAYHKIPLSRGGSNWISNIVPACGSCNCRKATRTAMEWLAALALARLREQNWKAMAR